MNHLDEHNKSSGSAGLVVITDESDNLDTYCFLLRYMSKKLNDLSLTLSKTFFITRHDFADIRRQVDTLLGSHPTSLRWLVVITTKSRNDSMLKQLCQNSNDDHGHTVIMSPRLVLYRSIMFSVDCDSFFESTASIVSYVLLNQACRRVRFLFDEKYQLDDFLNRFNKDDSQIKINDFKTSYSKYAIELSSTKTLSELPIKQNFDYFLNNNYINADYLVYNFITLSRKFLGSSTTTDDLKFLASKVDIDKLGEKLLHSISIIEQTLETSHPSQTCISFNGGKDCCVVLYLMYACALRQACKLPLNVVIIKIKNSFDEMDEFIFEELKSFYRGSLEYIVLGDAAKTLKQSLNDLKSSHPHLNNILMGTRRTDAVYFRDMSEFAPTDSDWPKFVRVNPILDWTYSEIWFFIRFLKLPYCELYNQGFTSIDCRQKTVPNPALFDPAVNSYLPAYFLENTELERNSRIK